MSKSTNREKDKDRLVQLSHDIREELRNADIAREAIMIAYKYLTKCNNQAEMLRQLQRREP